MFAINTELDRVLKADSIELDQNLTELVVHPRLKGVEVGPEVYNLLAWSRRLISESKGWFRSSNGGPSENLKQKSEALEAGLVRLYKSLAVNALSRAEVDTFILIPVEELRSALKKFEGKGGESDENHAEPLEKPLHENVDCDPALLANIFENIQLVKSNLETLKYTIGSHKHISYFAARKETNEYSSSRVKAFKTELENIKSDFYEAMREGEEKWFFYQTRVYLGALNQKINNIWLNHSYSYHLDLKPYKPLNEFEIDPKVYDLLASSKRVLEDKKQAHSGLHQKLSDTRKALEASLDSLYNQAAEGHVVLRAQVECALGTEVRNLEQALDQFELRGSRLRQLKAFGE